MKHPSQPPVDRPTTRKARPVLIEACVDSVSSAIEAQRGGAARVELCANLYEGGTTPSMGAIQAARQHLEIRLHVIIRPRGGDFFYSDVELDIMRGDVLRAGEAGADGVVFGILRSDGTIDMEQTGKLVELAGPMSTTFHRAFDMTADPYAALETLVALGIDRVLTSGQRPSAMEGADLLARLVGQAGGRLVVMPGVGIDAANIAGLIRRTGAPEYHVLAQKCIPSLMAFRNPTVFMGPDPDSSEYETHLADAEGIRAICAAAAPGPAGRAVPADAADASHLERGRQGRRRK